MSTSRNINQIYNSHPASSVLTSDLMYLPRSPFGLSNDMGINGQNLASALPKIAQGATDGSNAGSGIIGEYIESYIDTPFSITSGVNTDVTSIALTPGDWLLNGTIVFVAFPDLTAFGSVYGFFATASGDVTTGILPGKNDCQTTAQPTHTFRINVVLPKWRVNITSPQTYYLKAKAVWGTGDISVGGTIFARRRR
jgi:hypothetical protein